jgi:hypothetical protein
MTWNGRIKVIRQDLRRSLDAMALAKDKTTAAATSDPIFPDIASQIESPLTHTMR